MTILNIFLMGGAAAGGNPISTFLPLILIIVVFYFFMIYPQMKKTKAQKKFRETLDRGTKVVTIGGIHGKISEVGDNHFIIDSEGTKLKVDRTAISMESSQALNAPPKEDKK